MKSNNGFKLTIADAATDEEELINTLELTLSKDQVDKIRDTYTGNSAFETEDKGKYYGSFGRLKITEE